MGRAWLQSIRLKDLIKTNRNIPTYARKRTGFGDIQVSGSRANLSLVVLIGFPLVSLSARITRNFQPIRQKVPILVTANNRLRYYNNVTKN